MEKVKIVKCSYTNKKKDGTEIVNKWGKTSWRTGIQTQEYGDTWINGFLPFPPDRWEGTEQTIEIYDEEWNGEKRKAFKLPSKETGTNVEVGFLKEKVNKHDEQIKRILAHLELETQNEHVESIRDEEPLDQPW
jgi:hypothetical protein